MKDKQKWLRELSNIYWKPVGNVMQASHYERQKKILPVQVGLGTRPVETYSPKGSGGILR